MKIDWFDRRRQLLSALMVLTVLLALGFYFFGPLGDAAIRTTEFLLEKDGAREWVESREPYSVYYYIGLCAFQVVLAPIPGELSGFLGGMVFGWLPGFIFSTIGLTAGSLIAVSIGRIFERVFLEKVLPSRILDRFEDRSRKWGLLTVFILFLFPGLPKDTLCYLFGLTRMPIWIFIVVSSVGRLPGTLILTLQGDKVFEGEWTFFIVLTAVSIVILIPVLIYKDRLLKKFGIDGTGRYSM